MNDRTSPRRPNRTTVDLFLRVLPATKTRAETLAARAGLTVSAFVSARIEGVDERAAGGGDAALDREAARPAAHAADLAMAAHRIVVTLDALRKRAGEGGDLSGAFAELTALRKDVTEALIPLSQTYERNLDERRVGDGWNG